MGTGRQHIIHGKPRHPEIPGSVERAYQDIKHLFNAMIFGNSSSSWAKYVRQVLYIKNTSFYTTIGMTPFQALVHRKPPLGLTRIDIPIEATNTIWSGGDIDLVTEGMDNETTPLRPEEYDDLTEVHYYERQDSVIPLYSDQSNIYMEEIFLPPTSSLHVFEENTHPECPAISKFPPMCNLHHPQASIPPQASINSTANSFSSGPQAIHSRDTTSPPQSEDS